MNSARPPQRRNWAGNQRFNPAAHIEPETEDELIVVVRAAAHAGQMIRVAGSGHSFTGLIVTDQISLSVEHLDELHAVDRTSGLVTVGAGMTIRELNRTLDRHGLALENMGDIDAQTIAGAIGTGTHGTGARFGGIATQVHGLRLVLADGESREVDATHDRELFDAARIGLGAVGIITQLTLQCVPAFRLHAAETVEPLDAIHERWEELVDSVDHVEYFFMPGARRGLLKQNTRTDDPPAPLSRFGHFKEKIVAENLAFGAINRIGRRYPRVAPRIARFIDSAPSNRHYTDVSHRVFTTPRWVRFYETEWQVPLADLTDVVKEIDALARTVEDPITFPIEVRCAAADDIPLSTAHGVASGYVACHVYQGTPHEEYFSGVAAIARAAGGRPHWGKLHPERAADLASRYPRWDRFQATRARVDPSGRLANSYTDRVLGPINS